MRESTTQAVYTRKAKLLSVKLLHYLLMIALFSAAWMLFRYHTFRVPFVKGFRYNLFVIIGYAVILFFFHRTYNAYLLGYTRIRNLIFAQFLSQMFSIVIVYLAVSVSWNRFDNPVILFCALAVQIVIDVVWSWFSNGFYFRLNPPKKTVLIYRNAQDKRRFGVITGKPSERLYRITDEVMYDDSFAGIKEVLDEYEAVFVAGVNSRCRNGILKYCKERHIPGFFLPHVGDVIMQEARHIQAFDSPVLFVDRKVLNPEYAIIKRAFDIVVSLLGIIVLSPTLAITAIAIRAYDGGPALYKQVRLTLNGKEFRILKFRSMRVDAEKDGVARLSTGENDDRITPIGRIIRKCRIDELPQLFNILKGDMSVVGPRPERPEIAEQYCRTMPDFQLRLQVKAGLTGYAQIYGKYNTDPYEKLEFDLLYINSMNVLTDLKLVFATVGILFTAESTEGVAVGATTAMDHDNPAEEAEDAAEMVGE